MRRAIESAEPAPHGRLRACSAAVPVARAAVLEARTALLALADDLVELAQPDPRGVALTIRLLSDGGGPLYRPWRTAELEGAAKRARAAL